jgi:SEC-C motif-containing protein
MTETACPCRLREQEPLPYSACCGPYLEEGKPAPTAEALMRARYSAFAQHKIDFLCESLAPETRFDFDRKAIQHWSTQSRWLGLDVLSVEHGKAGDTEGFVEFIAHFELDGETRAHRERSKFRFEAPAGRWYFVEEANRKLEPIVKGAQPGRNDPCPCGSGKKYKKCCGVAA